MTDELDSQGGEHERALRALQQEHLRFKSAMETRLKSAEAGAVGPSKDCPQRHSSH
jgi:hypothetical protein